MIGLLLALSLLVTPPVYAAIDFDAADDSLTCGTGISTNGPLSVGYWFSADGLGEGSNGIPWTLDGGANGYLILRHTSSSDWIFFKNFATTDMEVSTTNTAPTGGKHHFLLTWDGTAESDNVHMYLDGGSDVVDSRFDGVGTENTGANTFRIGNNSAGSRTYDGRLEDFCVWSDVRSQSDAAQLYNSNLRMVCMEISTSTVIAYWPMVDQPAGTSADADTIHNLVNGASDCTGVDGANNTGLAWFASMLSHP